MELGLSLGSGGGSGPAAFIQPFPFLEKRKKPAPARTADPLGFCMGLGTACSPPREPPPVPRDFLPVHPPARRPLRFRWRPGARVPEPGLLRGPPGMWLDKNQRPAEEEHAGAAPPSLKMGISDLRTGVLGMKDNCDGGGSGGNGDGEMERGGCSSQLMRGSDEEENGGGLGRKKLRLTTEQAAFLEQSFKEQNTLNPKQKVALAKLLNLRPRQVEVWFQNRRARIKLKQTEVDCEHLKRCCERLKEDNKRLQKELHELRALHAASFYVNLPPTTLTMCPSCERVSSSSTAPGAGIHQSPQKPFHPQPHAAS
ncbi:unnamed protein product [Cuscuta campestris]|uniref:Homeobox domain-containing protein n=1 Tax=Cuscuta campestris TaxID=132261 RepID=A0A484LCN8_9ASTE|nr:unnamed protein product [Cuscuta campestris]